MRAVLVCIACITIFFSQTTYALETLTPYLKKIEQVSIKLANYVGTTEKSHGTLKETRIHKIFDKLYQNQLLHVDFRKNATLMLLSQFFYGRTNGKGLFEPYPQTRLIYMCENYYSFSVYQDYFVFDTGAQSLDPNHIVFLNHQSKEHILMILKTENNVDSYQSQDGKYKYFFDANGGRLYKDDVLFYMGCKSHSGGYRSLFQADSKNRYICGSQVIETSYTTRIKNGYMIPLNHGEMTLYDNNKDSHILYETTNTGTNILNYSSINNNISFSQSRETDENGNTKEKIDYKYNDNLFTCYYQSK